MVYGALTVVLAILYEGGSTVIERLLLTVTGQETITAAVAVSFAIGLLFHPLRRILQRVIDRWLFVQICRGTPPGDVWRESTE